MPRTNRAIEARKLFQYYNDLISEIQLLATIDGSDVVGHRQPFGVYLSIRHTSEIERESERALLGRLGIQPEDIPSLMESARKSLSLLNSMRKIVAAMR